VKTYVAAVEALRKKERGDETKFTTKIGGKISLGPRLPVILVLKIFIPRYAFDALICQNWSFSRPNRLTLGIALLDTKKTLDNFILSMSHCSY